MGSAASREAIRAIRDWAVNGPAARPTPRSADDFGRLVFSDAVQRIKLPRDGLQGPPPHHQPRRDASTCRWPTPSRSPSRTGPSSTAPPTTRTGSSRSPASPPRSTTPSSSPTPEGKAVTEFSGKELIKGEPDASSFPSGRHALHLRGARLHRVGPDQPALDLQDRVRHHAGHPERVRQLDRRVARQEDAAAALDRGAVQAGRPHPEAVRLDGRPRHDHLRPRAGILPDRRALLLRAPRPDRRRPHAVRRQAAQGPGDSRTSTSARFPSACSPACARSRTSSTPSACRSRRGTTRSRRASTRSRRSSNRPTSPPTTR